MKGKQTSVQFIIGTRQQHHNKRTDEIDTTLDNTPDFSHNQSITGV